MKLRSLLIGSLSMAWMAIASSCSTSHEAVSASGNNPEQNITGNDDPRILRSQEKLIEAKKMEMLGDEQQALNLYKECMKTDASNDAAYYNAARILFDQKQYSDALSFASQAVKLNSTNQWYLDLYATLLGGMGNFKEAIRVYQLMVQQNPDDVDAWFNLAFFLDQNKQPEEAINVFNQIEKQYGINEDITVEKEKLWMKMGKVDKAAAEVQRLIDAYPDEPKYYSMLVDLYMSAKMEDKAYEVLQEMIKIDPDNPRANLVMADYWHQKGDEQKSMEALKKAFASPDLDANIKVPILAGLVSQMQKDSGVKSEALDLGEILVKTHPDEAKTHALYGDVLYQADQISQALEEYKKAVGMDNSKFVIWQQVMLLYDRLNNNDSLVAVSNRAVELFPDQNMAYYFNGYANMQLKQYPEAIAAYGKAAAIGSDDKQFIAQLYSNMGDAYYNLKNSTASDSCYELALVFDPQNAYVLNNYSYYLSVRGQRLEDATKMASLANSISPNTAAYEDTYGWVLYKTENYPEAKIWLEKALRDGGDQDGTVLEHYGDVLYKTGDVNGAVQYWMKAKEKNVDSHTIDKKIAERKLYE
jgi:tetratricopeptide (TPR) repeat protein